MSRADDARNRRLLFAAELQSGAVRPSGLARSEVRAEGPTLRVPAAPVRRYQERLVHRGRLTFETRTEPRFMAARRAVLGPAADGPPRLLVRLGTLPPAGPAPGFERAAGLLADAGIPFLVAVPGGAFDAAGLDRLAALRRAGVELAACGTGEPLPRAGRRLASALDAADAALAAQAIRPDVFVAPDERLPWRAWEETARRYTLICAATPSIATLGWHDGPAWRGQAVWTPAYPPLAGAAADVATAVERLAARRVALWAPVALDWRREERGGPAGLERFVAAAAGLAVPWEALLDAARVSAREPGPDRAAPG